MNGRYIAFEGGEGSGKSTQARVLARRIDAVLTHEPGKTPLGAQLRQLLLGTDQAPVGARAETLMMAADRAQHIEQVVAPALTDGRHVVSDRTAYSSLAYQGGGRGLGVDAVRTVNDWALDGHWPDVVVLLDCPPGQGPRGRPGNDRLEQEAADFHEAVRTTYLAVADEEPERFIVLPALGTIDEVADRVWAALTDRFEWDDAGRGGR